MHRSALIGRVFLASVLSITILVLVSTVPTLVAIENDERIILSTFGLRASIEAFVEDVREGRVDRFYMGRTPRYLTEELPRYALNSAAFILPASVLATVYAFAVPLLRRTVLRRSPSILQWLAIVPVFLVAMLLQWLALKTNLWLDRHIFTLAYLGGSGMPVLLPSLTILLPIVALSLRATEATIEEMSHSEHIRAALGRSVPQGSLWFRHVGAGVLFRLEDLLPRTAATALGTLFIAERVFNLPGITVMLFEFPYSRVLYDYPPVLVESVLEDGTVELISRYGGGARTTSVQFEVVLMAAVAIAALYVVSIVASRAVISIIRRSVR